MSSKLVCAALMLFVWRSIAMPEESFCGNKCSGEGVVTSRSCHCDQACAVYNDCCSDSKYLDTNFTASAMSVVCKRKSLVVNSCSDAWNGPDFIINSCESRADIDADPVGDDPVTSETTGITYSNYYCAICNGDAETAVMWNIKVSCPAPQQRNLSVDGDEALNYIFYNHLTTEWGYVVRDEESKKITFHGCAVTSDIPEHHKTKVRSCGVELVKTCDPSWKMDLIRDMCVLSYTDPVFSGGSEYRNFYCTICNRVDQSKVSCGAAIGPRTSKQPDSELKNQFSFSLLLDINFSDGNSVGKRPALNCMKGEIFDPFARRCRNIVCGVPGYVLQNGVCVPDTQPPI